jgi:hypothetical protein
MQPSPQPHPQPKTLGDLIANDGNGNTAPN